MAYSLREKYTAFVLIGKLFDWKKAIRATLFGENPCTGCPFCSDCSDSSDVEISFVD